MIGQREQRQPRLQPPEQVGAGATEAVGVAQRVAGPQVYHLLQASTPRVSHCHVLLRNTYMTRQAADAVDNGRGGTYVATLKPSDQKGF